MRKRTFCRACGFLVASENCEHMGKPWNNESAEKWWACGRHVPCAPEGVRRSSPEREEKKATTARNFWVLALILMSLSRRGNRTQRDEDTAATVAELKQGQDKLVELVQVSVRTASPLSCSPPTNPRTPHKTCMFVTAKHFTDLALIRASTVSCGRSRRSRGRS